jgi:cell division septum initiation protein DivIVA
VTDQYLDDIEESEQDVSAEAVISQVLDIVNNAKSMPLSSSVMVSREEVISLLRVALDRLPDELRQARWLLREREEFLAERTREAETLMEEVRAQAERMVQRTEIVRQANSVAQRILDDANDEARTMRHEAEDFCDQKLAGMEIVLDRLTRTVQSGRAKLASPPPPAQAPAERGSAGAGAGAGASANGSGTEEDGFFDQDVS